MMNVRRSIVVLAAALCSVALLAACGGGTSSSDKTATARAGGVGGAEITPVSTVPSAARTAVASPSPAATGASTAISTTPSAGGGASVQLQIATTGEDIKYDKDTLNAAAGAQVTLTYTNDSSLPHNWHLFDGNDASAPSIAQTQIKTGPNATETVSFTAPSQPGKYFFHCDVHLQQMTGFLVVQ